MPITTQTISNQTAVCVQNKPPICTRVK